MAVGAVVVLVLGVVLIGYVVPRLSGGSEVTTVGAFEVAGGPVENLEVSPQGDEVAVVSRAGLSVCTLPQGACRLVTDSALVSHTFPTVAFSPDASLVVVNATSTVQVWDVRSGALRASVPEFTPGSTYRAAAFSPDGKQVAVVDEQHVWVVDLADPHTGRPLRTGLFGVGLPLFRFGPDGTWLVCMDRYAQGVVVFDARTGATLRVIDQGDGVIIAALSRDTRTVVTHGVGNIRRFDTGTGRQIGAPVTDGAPTPGRAGPIAISPDGSRVAEAVAGGGVLVWDTRSGRRVGRPLTYHPRFDGPLTALSFTPDGRRLVGDMLGTVVEWRAR